MEFKHTSVLLNESIDLLNVVDGGIYVDGTLGGGGHSEAILKRANCRLIGIDRDDDALKAAGERLKPYGDRVTLVKSNFADVTNVLDSLGIDKIDGCILDLGVSSYQLDNAQRGFSYQHSAPLDMRMDQSQYISAFNVVNEYSVKELTRIIRDYGEEQWASRIAQYIENERQKGSINTTGELVEIIKRAIPTRARRTGPHPAKRTFQAIRIEVNNELAILEKTVRAVSERLNPKGRMCVITFHSLEDRIIKHTMQNLANPCTCPPRIPVCICGKVPTVKVVTKAITPSEEELTENSRSKSAKLRVMERL
ncbi:MAG: 16S rRNA (cytosine(1402)-N(4))-methyltransferase RsmH [Clostridia bacterium]|nr:16S rRNA (cytosine(1402)-N(4))-methyltransferase RsmH [Clostridia bacterium]